MPRAIRVLLAFLLAAAVAPSLAVAAPTIAVTASCAYVGGRFAIAGKGFDPGAAVVLQVMPTADPLAGDPLAAHTTSADPRGTFVEIFDVPPTADTSMIARSVRARSPKPDGGTPLATAPLRTATRVVDVSGERALRTGATQRWQLTGLPEGTRMYAHLRRAGRTVARTALGEATDPCGRMDFDLPALLGGAPRHGTFELWMTADRAFRRPLKGVYIHRRLTVTGAGASARVEAGSVTGRLAPLDPRLTAPVTNGMAADTSRIGLIDLAFVDAAGSSVEFLERIGDRLVRVGTAQSDQLVTVLLSATTWSCDRTERRFVATATRPDGSLALAGFSVRTPSCATRFELTAPRRLDPGEVARVKIVDRWGIGKVTPQLCVTPPEGPRACRPVALRHGATVAVRRFRATARGDWSAALRVRDRNVAAANVTVGQGAVRPDLPTVLATGDSTMQGIDGFLGDELAGTASVVSDVRIGTAISKSGQPGLPQSDDPAALQWLALATQQTARLRQAATVVSLGAAEGFPMVAPDGTRVVCCDAPWSAEYARRARLMMLAYARRERARVLWLTVPLPRDDRRLTITRAVNGAIVTAAQGIATAKVLRMDLVFTPNGYVDVIRYKGRDVAVRDTDGVHLNVAGTAIAAKIVAQELLAER